MSKFNLYEDLSKIGFRVNANSNKSEDVDIETTLLKAIGEFDNDSRMISLVFSWLTVHHKQLLADKLFRNFKSIENKEKYRWFPAVCSFLVHLKDFRFSKGVSKAKKPIYIGDRNNSLSIKRKGNYEFLEGLNFFIPIGNVRIREKDILNSKDLSTLNLQYRNRLIFGPNWRSDIITSFQQGYKNANQISVHLGLNRSRVGEVLKSYKLIEEYIV
jgi:hypothetical protein